MQARVLYDFDGDTENGELVIKEGVKITVHNQVCVYVCLHVYVVCCGTYQQSHVVLLCVHIWYAM